MAFPPDNPRTYILRVNAAKLGCAICQAPPRRLPPAGEPFPSGPYQGRYWCADCWTLYYDEHGDHLADVDTQQYVQEEAKKIRLDRLRKGAEMIYQDGEHRAFLTDRGTILFDIQSTVAMQPMEFDPERFGALLKAVLAVKGKVPGYEPVPAA